MPIKTLIPHRLSLVTPTGSQPISPIAAGMIAGICELQEALQMMGTGVLEIHFKADSDVQIHLQNIYRVSLVEFSPEDYGLIMPARVAT